MPVKKATKTRPAKTKFERVKIEKKKISPAKAKRAGKIVRQAKTVLGKKKKAAVGKAVKIQVRQTDYLDHTFSPHLVDLKEFAPKRPVNFYFAEPPAELYFENFKPKNNPVVPSGPAKPAKPVKESPPVLFEADELGQKIDKLRKEIGILEELIAPPPPPPTAKPVAVAEPPVVFQVRKVTFNPFTLTKKVVVYLDSGVNRMVDPLRQIPLSAKSKAVIGFAVIALLLVLPIGGLDYYKKLKGKEDGVLSFAKAATDNLKTAGDATLGQNYAGAEEQFNVAYKKFSAAKGELDSINKLVTTVIGLLPGTDRALETANALLQIGQDLSVVGHDLAGGLSAWEGDTSIVEKISVLRKSMFRSAPLVAEIARELEKVDIEQLPAEERFKFMQLQHKMPLLNSSFKNFVELAELAEEFLGRDELRRYLILFQNNNEIRPTGGFIGSYALVDVVNGEVRKMEIPGGGSYDLQGSLRAQVAAPQPLRLINSRWEFQDSNWFPDWPTAAEKIIWFYNQADGPTVDGVIAINADMVQKLLDIVGPIQTDAGEITAASFFDTTQKKVEQEFDPYKNKPKEIIGDMAVVLLDKLLAADKDQLVAIVALLNSSLVNKDFQLYSTNPKTEAKLAEFGWDNAIEQTAGDYLMLVNTNIAGQKTDAVIDQEVMHEATILPGGTVRDKVTIVRTHNGVSGEDFYGVRNVNYLRLYVPAGSKLLAASGLEEPPAELFKAALPEYQQDQDLIKISGLTKTDAKTGVKINDEFGKTVFSGWTQVDPGQRLVITFEYELPFKVSFARYQTGASWLNLVEEKLKLTDQTTNYSLLVQKQSGVDEKFYSFVDLPSGWQPVWQYPDQLRISASGWQYSDYLYQDKFFSVMFKQ